MYNFSFTHTPENWRDLLDWVYLHKRDEYQPLERAAIIGYNMALVSINRDNSREPLPLYQMTSVEDQYYSSYEDAMKWTHDFSGAFQSNLMTAYAKGWNFAAHCFEIGNLREIANELASMTYEERVEASLFPLLYNNDPNDFSGLENGSIYILARDSGNIVKVGETSRDPRTRSHEYIAEYKLVGFNFHKAYSVPMAARKEIERAAHEKLKHRRLSWDDTTGAREIFECTIHEAEHAVTEAIKESEAAKIARKEEYERQRLRRAEYRFNNELESYTREWMKDWDDSDTAKQSIEALESFIMSNSFEKPGVRGVFGYFWLILGWIFKAVSFLGLVGLMKHIIFDPIDFTMLWMMPTLCLMNYGVGWVFVGLSQPIVPDSEQIAKRESMEQDLKRLREEERMRAEASFRAVNSVSEFS